MKIINTILIVANIIVLIGLVSSGRQVIKNLIKLRRLESNFKK